MSNEPMRLRDDPHASSALRRDLSLAAKSSPMPAGFDAAAAMARFEATRANGSSNTASTHAAPTRSTRWWGLGAVGLATLLALAAWGAFAMRAPRDVVVARGSVTSGTAQTNPARLEPSTSSATQPIDPGTHAPSANVTHENAHAAPTNVLSNATQGSSHTANALAANGTSAAPSTSESRGAHRATDPSLDATIDRGDDLLARDVRMLTDTYAALSIDPARALTLANTGEHEFPGSVHVEEREAIAVRALVSLHRNGEARTRGERFLSRWSTGPYAGAVRQSLYENVRDH